MSTLLCWIVGLLFSISIYLLLNRNLVRVLFGIMLIGTSINLLIFTVGRITYNSPPFIYNEDIHSLANALPQSLILTAIVIGFGIVTYALILITKSWQELGTMSSDKMLQADSRFVDEDEDLT
jgi:multicomponent Na+:H+ antiporter subunit C